MEFKIGQLLKLDTAFYIVDGLTDSGKPNRVYNANKYGEKTGSSALTHSDKNGWEVSWEIVEPLDPKYAKYEKVIAKMHQLDRKFQNRDMIKKDLTASNLADIMTRLAESLGRANSTGTYFYANVNTDLTWSSDYQS